MIEFYICFMEGRKMNRKTVSGIMVALLLAGISISAFNIQPVKAIETIYIRSDGSIDPATAPIQRDGDLYTLTGNITCDADGIVIERNNMTLDGAGYTLQGAGSRTGISLSGRSNVTIKNMRIKDFMGGVYLKSSSNNTISGNNITNNYYGIQLYEFSYNNSVSRNNIANGHDGIGLRESSNNNISENSIANSQYGIIISESSDNSISGNNITNNWDGIYLYESSDNILRDNVVTGKKCKYVCSNFEVQGSELLHFINNVDASNTVDGKPIYYWINRRDMTVPLDAGYVALINCTSITAHNLNLTYNAQGALVAYTTNSTLTKNSMAHNFDGIYLYESSNNSITENNITNKNAMGIRLSESSNNSIFGNNITNNGNGVKITDSSDNNISMNNVTNNIWDGIELQWSSNNNSISGNAVTNNVGGIRLYESSNNSVTGNNVAANHYYGISISKCSDNSISRNNITNNRDGILLYNSSNSISGNTITNNGDGITLWNSSSSSISGNAIANNGRGIRLSESSSNRFCHNNFIDNTKHVYDLSWDDPKLFNSVNSWDDGYPSGGNYWSDYEVRYPDAEELDGSGIWDTPYEIDENNQDNYPLMEPWVHSGVIADLVRRRAWSERHHFDISKDEDEHQTLYAKVKNLGNQTVWVKAVFNITKDGGFSTVIESEPLLIEVDAIVELSADFGPLTNADAGKYYVSATCCYSQNKIVWREGEKEKTFKFNVVP